MPLKMESTMRPLPIKYTLDTSFVLSNSPDENEDSKRRFDGYFREGNLCRE